VSGAGLLDFPQLLSYPRTVGAQLGAHTNVVLAEIF
jgi:hypothetical protein